MNVQVNNIRTRSASSRRYNLAQKVRRGLLSLLVGAYLIMVLFPFYWMLSTALKPKTDIFLSPPLWFPSRVTLSNFVAVWHSFPLARYFINSISVTSVTVVFSVILASMAGYALSRIKFRGGTLFMGLLLFTQLVPGIITIIPFYFWMMNLGLLNTYTGLILAYITWSVPFSTLMLRSYFKDSCPIEVEESALIDGCTRFSAFYRIALPISAPGLVAVGANAFMLAWNEFMWASIMINSGELKTLSVGLRDMIGESGSVDFISEFMATAVLAAIPVIVIFFFAQRHIQGGLSVGSVKG